MYLKPLNQCIDYTVWQKKNLYLDVDEELIYESKKNKYEFNIKLEPSKQVY